MNTRYADWFLRLAGAYRTVEGRVVQSRNGMLVVRVARECERNQAECRGCRLCEGPAPFSTLKVPISPSQHVPCGATLRLDLFTVHEALAAALVFGLPLTAVLVAAFWQLQTRPTFGPREFLLTSIAFCIGLGLVAAGDRLIHHFFPQKILAVHVPQTGVSSE